MQRAELFKPHGSTGQMETLNDYGLKQVQVQKQDTHTQLSESFGR